METIIPIIILAIMGIVCGFLHKNKGYSFFAGFLWGFIFNIIGLLIVFFERDKQEQMQANKEGLSMSKWLLIFLGVGILLIVIFFFIFKII